MTATAPPRRTGRPPLSDAERAARLAAKAGPRTRKGHPVLAAQPLAALAGKVPDAVLAVLMRCSPSAARKLRKAAGRPFAGPDWAADPGVRHDVLAAAAALPGEARAAAVAVIRQWIEVVP